MPHRVLLLTALLGLSLGLVRCQPASDAAGTPADTTTTLPDSVLTPPDAATGARFAEVMQFASPRSDTTSIGRLMQSLGLRFRGRPYLEGTLDEPASETLVVRLDGFDCVTFVETMMAMARGAAAGDTTYAGFARRLAEQRYRNGTLDGYCGRLHYFSEWLLDNEERGLVRVLDDELGGRPLADTIHFMSTHRSAYDRFATNDSLHDCVKDMEARLSERLRAAPLRYIPQDSIQAVYDQLRAGDIVASVTSIGGLDVTHTGLVYAHDDGGRGLLHASLSGGVTVSPDLQRYVQTIDRQIGIVVARPQPGP